MHRPAGLHRAPGRTGTTGWASSIRAAGSATAQARVAVTPFAPQRHARRREREMSSRAQDPTRTGIQLGYIDRYAGRPQLDRFANPVCRFGPKAARHSPENTDPHTP